MHRCPHILVEREFYYKGFYPFTSETRNKKGAPHRHSIVMAQEWELPDDTVRERGKFGEGGGREGRGIERRCEVSCSVARMSLLRGTSIHTNGHSPIQLNSCSSSNSHNSIKHLGQKLHRLLPHWWVIVLVRSLHATTPFIKETIMKHFATRVSSLLPSLRCQVHTDNSRSAAAEGNQSEYSFQLFDTLSNPPQPQLPL